MAKRTILVDSARRELEKHGTETFPMTVNHDDLWSFEGKNVPIHWHNDLEINLIREGEAVFQVYQECYRVRPGEGFLLNRNVPHSCSSAGNEHVRYSTILVRPDFLYGDFGSDVERKCFQPFLQNSAIPCIYLTGFDENGKEILQKLNQVEEAFDRKRFCYELKIKGLLCEAFAMILYGHRQELTKFVPANLQELERLEKMLNYLNMHRSNFSSGPGRSGAFVKRSLLPPFQKNDRQNYHRISGRIPCQQKLFAGAEWTVFYDTDHRNGGIQ